MMYGISTAIGAVVGCVFGFYLCSKIKWRSANNLMAEMRKISRGVHKAAKRVKKK